MCNGLLMSGSYNFRDVAPGVHFATASDRYAAWVGQIYSPVQKYPISKTKKTIRGQTFMEEKLPVRSVAEYFEHYSAIELDFTFYAYLLDRDGAPTRSHAPLAEYAKWLPADALVVLKVPETICATRRLSFESGHRTIEKNPDFLNPTAFVDQFFRPAIALLGDRIVSFSFEKGYQRKAESCTAADNIQQLETFFSTVPDDDRYHIEERTDRLKTPDYFAFLREHQIGNIFSHWTWLPNLKRQWDQAGGFTNPRISVTRLLTPLQMAYEESYARYYPFSQLKDEVMPMYSDAAFLIREGLEIDLPTITVVNNRAGGNANEVSRRVRDELLKLL